jgi:hypothetical protein
MNCPPALGFDCCVFSFYSFSAVTALGLTVCRRCCLRSPTR